MRDLTHRPTATRGGRGPVFVSYRHSEAGIKGMLTVRRLLHTAGIPTWIDQDALWAGDIDGNISSIIEAGASGAVVILTKDVTEAGNYVLTKEIPAFVELAKDVFFIAVINAVTTKDGTLDPDAPERILAEFWPSLQNQMRYSIATQADRESFVRAMVGTRCTTVAEGEVRVGIQTRVHAQGGNPDDCDFDFRLDSDATDITSREDFSSWVTCGQLANRRVKAVSPARVRISGGAQPGVGAALGAMFNAMRYPKMTILQGGTGGDEWPGEQRPSAQHTVTCLRQRGSSVRAPFAVLVRMHKDLPDHSFHSLVESLPVGASYLIEVCRKDGQYDQINRIDPPDGEGLALQIGEHLRQLKDEHGPKLHLCVNGAFPLAVQIGRQLNTFQTVLYDLAKETDEAGEPVRRYVPIALAESNGEDDWPVRPVDIADIWPAAEESDLALINHTPHDVTLYRGDVPVTTWPVVQPMARLDEARMPGTTRGFRNSPDGAPVDTPIDLVQYGSAVDLPPAQHGVGYIVSRVLAERIRRPDLFFPSREVRDDQGRIIGCEALGHFPPRLGVRVPLS